MRDRPVPVRAPSSGPRLLLIAAGLGFLLLMVGLPLVSVFFHALDHGWDRFWRSVTRPDARQALRLSLEATFLAVAFNTLFGILAALVLARRNLPGKTLLLSLLDLPLSIPPVVAGLMLVLLFGRHGWFGPWCARHGLRVLFAFPGICLATAFVSLPYVVREVLPLLEEVGTSAEEASRVLGGNGWQTFWHVTLPSIRWGLLYGVLQCAARCLGEFGAVSVVSGKLIGKTNTLPLHIERMYLEYDTPGAFGAAIPLVTFALLTLILQGWLRHRFAGAEAAVPALPVTGSGARARERLAREPA